MASANTKRNDDLAAVIRSFIMSDLLLIKDHVRQEERTYRELLVLAEDLESVREDTFYQAAAARLECVENWSDEDGTL